MSRNKVALILSIICCGLGQMYNGEILKGINFMVLFVALIITPIFFPPHLPLLRLIGIAVVIFLWLVGMLDAYTSAEGFMEEKPRLALLWIRTLLSFIAILAAIVTIGLIMLWPQKFLAEYRHSSAYTEPSINQVTKPDVNADTGYDEQNEEKMTVQQSADTEIREESQSESPQSIMDYEIPESSPYFTIQVGAFSDENTAISTASNLRQRGYSVYIISPSNGVANGLYKVQLGKFESEDRAKKTADRMLENREVDTAIVVHVNLKSQEN